MARARAERNPWSDADVARHWDRVAEVYAAENLRVAEAHAQRFEVAVPLLELAPGSRVLNVSSRDCEAEDFIRRACPEADVVHAEISGGLIAVAARLRPEARQTKIATYAKLPFADAEFDRVLSLETLEHVAEPLAFLRELRRVARPGGLLVLSCPPRTAEIPYRLYTFLFGGHGEGPHRFLASRELKALLQEAGWKLERHFGTLLVPAGPRFLRRLGERAIERCQGTFVSELGIRQFYVARNP
ncbi:MAG: class I SAM-dependent methyltransferase [Planctomycetota bacterium]